MDGQYRFLALNKKSDWDKGRGENLLIAENGVSLPRDEKYGLYRTVPQIETDITEPIVNLCSGPFGLLLILDRAANIWTYDYINGQTICLLSEGHGLFTSKALMGAAKDLLYLLEPEPSLLLAVSVSNGQVLWKSSEFYASSPLAMVASEREGLLVISAFKRVLSGPEDGEDDPVRGRQMLVLQVSHDGLTRVVSAPPAFTLDNIEGWPWEDRIKAATGLEGNLYVLDSCNGRLWVFAPDGNLINNRRLDLTVGATGFGVDSEGFMYIAGVSPAREESSNEGNLLKFSPRGEAEAMGDVAYHGKIDNLWLDQFNRLYVWNRSEYTLSIMERQQNTRLDASGAPRGTFIFPVIDSTVMEMEWHRIVLDVHIPDDTQIQLSYFASDSTDVIVQDHLVKMQLYLHDSAVSMAEILDNTGMLWRKAMVNPKDALLPGARGRYLWLKMDLVGSELKTPLLHSVKVYFPRMSLLDYLPAIYQEDEGSRDFLERFLSLFGTFLQGMEEQIEQVYRIFDPEVVSGPFIHWLAGWLGVSIDKNWNDEQLRRLLLAAPQLYKKRGTREELEEIIAVYTGEKPIIVEYFQYKYLQEIPEVKKLMSQLYGQDPYAFTVLVNQEVVSTAAQISAVQRIIEQEKPAFTEGKLVILQPWIYMDIHSYLGINTYLSELSLLRLNNKSVLPFGSVIVEQERDNRLDTHSRMELDAHLE